MASKARCVTCDDCYFRKDESVRTARFGTVSTFRPMLKGQMVPPPQPRLIVRPELAAAV